MVFVTINGDLVGEVDDMFEKGKYFSILYCLCFVDDISDNMTEKQVMEDTDPDL